MFHRFRNLRTLRQRSRTLRKLVLLTLTASFASLVHAALPMDTAVQIRVNQLGYYPSSNKTATLLVDTRIGTEEPGTNYIYGWHLVRVSDNVVVRRVGTGLIDYFEAFSHPLPPLHAGPSDKSKNGESQKPFYNPTNQWMYQLDFSTYTTEGTYRIELIRQLNAGSEKVVWYYSPNFVISKNNLASQYRDLTKHAFNYYYFHRLGEHIFPQDVQAAGMDPIYQRASLHGKAVPCLENSAGVPWCGAGVMLGEGTAWADAGDFGLYPVNHAMAAWQMLNAVEVMGEPADLNIVQSDVPMPEAEKVLDPSSNLRVKILEEVVHGSQYFKNMLPPNTQLLAPHKIQNDNWGDGLDAWTVAVELGNEAGRRAAAPSTASTLAICRTSAHLARVLYKYGYIDEAIEWQELATEARLRASSLPEQLFYRQEIADPVTGQSYLLLPGAGPYNDADISDDIYACDTEYYLSLVAAKTANNPPSEQDLLLARDKVINSPLFAKITKHNTWEQVAGMATLSLLSAPNGLTTAQVDLMKSNLFAEANLKLELLTPYSYYNPGGAQNINPRLATTLSAITDPNDPNKIGKWYWGSNSFVVNDAQLMTIASKLSPANTTPRRDYARAALRSMDYILGENAVNLSYVTGFGTYAEEDTHDRHAWTASKQYSASNKRPYPKGWLSGGPQNDWSTCMIGEHMESFDDVYETGTPFWYANNTEGFLTAADAYDNVGGFGFQGSELDNLILGLYQQQYSNLPLNSPYVAKDPSGNPLASMAPASAYGAIGKAGSAWCSKENTINWNSGLLWMGLASSRLLPTLIGNTPDQLPIGNVQVTKIPRPVEQNPPGGECVDLILTNTSSQMVEWQAVFEVPGQVYDFWNAEWVQQGQTVVASAQDSAGWGRYLAPGQSTPPEWFGYCSSSRNQSPVPPTPPTDPSKSVQVVIDKSWNGGFCAKVTVTNNTNAMWTWQVPLYAEGTIYSAWNMDCSLTQGSNANCLGSKGALKIKGVEWNSKLYPAGDPQGRDRTRDIGFCANK